MENLRNRRKIDLVTSETKLKKLAAKPSFKCFTIFHENLVSVERKQVELVLNRPIFVGFAVLDLSKEFMYRFHYGYIKEKYPEERSKLLFTDTDSLTYIIQTENVFEDFYRDKELFDFSDYDETSRYFNVENKKVIGKMKDEMKGVLIQEFIGLRAKMYSLLKGDNKEMKRAKGVKKNIVKNEIRHQHYKTCLFDEEKFMHSMCSIRSEKHQLYTIKQNKSSLSFYDDKRYLLADGITSLLYGHYKNN